MLEIKTPFFLLACEEYDFPKWASILKKLTGREDILYKQFTPKNSEDLIAVFYIEGEEEEKAQELEKRYGK